MAKNAKLYQMFSDQLTVIGLAGGQSDDYPEIKQHFVYDILALLTPEQRKYVPSMTHQLQNLNDRELGLNVIFDCVSGIFDDHQSEFDTFVNKLKERSDQWLIPLIELHLDRLGVNVNLVSYFREPCWTNFRYEVLRSLIEEFDRYQIQLRYPMNYDSFVIHLLEIVSNVVLYPINRVNFINEMLSIHCNLM